MLINRKLLESLLFDHDDLNILDESEPKHWSTVELPGEMIERYTCSIPLRFHGGRRFLVTVHYTIPQSAMPDIPEVCKVSDIAWETFLAGYEVEGSAPYQP